MKRKSSGLTEYERDRIKGIEKATKEFIQRNGSQYSRSEDWESTFLIRIIKRLAK